MQFLENIMRYIISSIGLSEQSESIWEVFLAKFLLSVSELLILFMIILFIVQYLMTFINPEKIKNQISKVSPLLAHIFAAIFGAITPFCTCSGVPVFAGLIKTGIPTGVAFSFLITSPLVNTIALAGLWTIFGAKVAILYVIFGLGAGILGGMILSFFKIDTMLVSNLSQTQSCCSGETKNTTSCCSSESNSCCSTPAPSNRLKDSWKETWSIISPVIPYLLIGSAIGIWITMGFSKELISSLSNYNRIITVPLAIIIGAPIYTSTISILPVIGSLHEQGLGIGVCFALLMSVGGMSFPEWTLLAGIMKRKLLFLFIGITGSLILIISYLFSILEFYRFL
ncbi:MAG: permease [Brevinema sp.]